MQELKDKDFQDKNHYLTSCKKPPEQPSRNIMEKDFKRVKL